MGPTGCLSTRFPNIPGTEARGSIWPRPGVGRATTNPIANPHAITANKWVRIINRSST
jgi:hypothetical protein